MSSKTALIKNMVCHRCTLAVENVLKEIEIPFGKVVIGEIHLREEISKGQNDLLRTGLAAIGLELIDNQMTGLIEKIND